MEGEGVFIWPDGRKYIGKFENDKRDGYGEYKFKDGRMYKGNWKNGFQHGEGQFYNPKNNLWIKGIWINGKLIKDKI